MLNKVAPWDFLNIDIQEPSTLILPNAEKLQEEKLFELEAHPLVSAAIVREAAVYIRAIIDKLL